MGCNIPWDICQQNNHQKQARVSAGLSQKELSIGSGIDEFSASARMNQYETGKHQPDFSTLKPIIAIEENKEIAACAGFRFITTLAWGKILYIDDLITKTEFRGKGYGKKLLQHLTQIGKTHLCEAIHLDTGYTRHVAHKTYLQQGLELHAHHLALKLE